MSSSRLVNTRKTHARHADPLGRRFNINTVDVKYAFATHALNHWAPHFDFSNGTKGFAIKTKALVNRASVILNKHYHGHIKYGVVAGLRSPYNPKHPEWRLCRGK